MERRTAIYSKRFFAMNALLCITPDSIPSPFTVDTNLLQHLMESQFQAKT